MRITDEPIVVEYNFKTSIDKVWKAITNLEDMKKWYFGNIDSFRPEVGYKTQLEVQVEDRKFTHLWEITEVIPNQKITYNWKYAEYPGDSYVSFRLLNEKSHVKLKLSVDVVENFPDDIPEFTRASCIQGWNYFIGKNLKKYLEELDNNLVQ